MKDQLGREITRGSYIVYPGRRGSTLWITLAHVQELSTRPSWRTEPTPIIKVQPIDPKTRTALGKPSQLTRVDLVTVVDLTNNEA